MTDVSETQKKEWPYRELEVMGIIADAVKDLNADEAKRVKAWFNSYQTRTLELLVDGLEEVGKERDEYKKKAEELEAKLSKQTDAPT